MQIEMHVNDVDPAEAFTSYVERRLRFALGAGGPDHRTHWCRRPRRAPVPH
jgi:hypothetical protein